MKGTHGTCHSFAELINKEGFKISGSAMRGAGVYFWSYTSDDMEDYVRDLAVKWWLYQKKKGSYSKAKNKNCCVIYASFKVGSDQSFDLENQVVREKFIKFSEIAYHKKISEGKATSVAISEVYDMFINDVEKKLKRNFSLIHVKIQQPKGFKTSLPLDIRGQPFCYVVKDVSCISVENFEEINYE